MSDGENTPTRIFEFYGNKYADRDLYRIDEKPTPLMLRNLTGIVDYLNANIDKLDMTEIFCHIHSPSHVVIYSTLDGARRVKYVEACTAFQCFRDYVWLSRDDFLAQLHSFFEDDEDSDKGKLIKFAQGISLTKMRYFSHDGVTKSENFNSIILPSDVVKLRTYATFAEIEQPMCHFYLSVSEKKEDILFMLSEVHDTKWELKVAADIRQFLQERVAGLRVIS